MAQPKIVSLNLLSESHDDKILELAKAIRGEGALWTSNMRATVRGGKPCGLTRIDD